MKHALPRHSLLFENDITHKNNVSIGAMHIDARFCFEMYEHTHNDAKKSIVEYDFTATANLAPLLLLPFFIFDVIY